MERPRMRLGLWALPIAFLALTLVLEVLDRLALQVRGALIGADVAVALHPFTHGYLIHARYTLCTSRMDGPLLLQVIGGGLLTLVGWGVLSMHAEGMLRLLRASERVGSAVRRMLSVAVLMVVTVLMFFLPPARTTIDREARVLRIVRYEWLVVPRTRVIAFDQVRSIEHRVSKWLIHRSSWQVSLDLYAMVGKEAVPIGQTFVDHGEFTLRSVDERVADGHVMGVRAEQALRHIVVAPERQIAPR